MGIFGGGAIQPPANVISDPVKCLCKNRDRSYMQDSSFPLLWYCLPQRKAHSMFLEWISAQKMWFCSTTLHPSTENVVLLYNSPPQPPITGFPSWQTVEKPEWVWKMSNLLLSDLHLTHCWSPLGRMYSYQMGHKTKIIYKWALPTRKGLGFAPIWSFSLPSTWRRVVL